MSYDIYLDAPEDRCQACGREHGSPDLPGPTYNLTPIFDLALTGEPLPNPNVSEGHVVLLRAATDRPRGLRVLSGRLAEDTVTRLESALAALNDPARDGEFRALEPENGWGTLRDARSVIDRMLDAAREYPKYRWRIR